MEKGGVMAVVAKKVVFGFLFGLAFGIAAIPFIDAAFYGVDMVERVMPFASVLGGVVIGVATVWKVVV